MSNDDFYDKIDSFGKSKKKAQESRTEWFDEKKAQIKK
jgi:hypothetical protein